MSRELDSEHLSEQSDLQAALDSLSAALHATDGMPIDEHCQLLCSELWFKQRQQLATVHGAEHHSVPQSDEFRDFAYGIAKNPIGK